MDPCTSCGDLAVILDDSIGRRVCTSCGVEHDTDVFQSQAFTSDGVPTTTLVSDFGYREAKLHRANALIANLTSLFGLSPARAADVSRMAAQVTDGELGGGDWFDVLIAACSYITMRQHRLPLSLAELAAAIGRDVHEIGRMVVRVSDYLGIEQLPEFESRQALERAVKNSPCFRRIESEKKEEMMKQGRFLLECAVKWFLSTGRQPLPLVAAVLAFVSEVNGAAVAVEDIAKEIHAGVATSKLRRKELAETLVKAAKALLPWGKDVNVKNVVHNAPLLLRFMEIKSKSESFDMGTFGIGLEDEFLEPETNDSIYFKESASEKEGRTSSEELGKLKLSANCLSELYKKALERCHVVKSTEFAGQSDGRKRRKGGLVIDAQMSCDTTSSLQQILEKDLGFDPPPPSFVSGLEARKRRREKIEAAKIRILRVVKPKSTLLVTNQKVDRSSSDKPRKRKQKGKREGSKEIDWEDCIVELLLLHQVSEEEILQGHYKRLLDLHIFNSSSTHNQK